MVRHAGGQTHETQRSDNGKHLCGYSAPQHSNYRQRRSSKLVVHLAGPRAFYSPPSQLERGPQTAEGPWRSPWCLPTNTCTSTDKLLFTVLGQSITWEQHCSHGFLGWEQVLLLTSCDPVTPACFLFLHSAIGLCAKYIHI